MTPVVAFLVWLACTLASVVAGFVVGFLTGAKDGREGIDLDALDQPRGALRAVPADEQVLRIEWFMADGSTCTSTYQAVPNLAP